MILWPSLCLASLPSLASLLSVRAACDLDIACASDAACAVACPALSVNLSMMLFRSLSLLCGLGLFLSFLSKFL